MFAMLNEDLETAIVKVVVAGPFAAGKTTFISALSEIPVLTSETAVTDETSNIKDHTTVALDFGRINVPAVDDEPAIQLYLFGTPGQDRFDFMWDIAAQGMAGLVLLVDVTAPDTWDAAARIAEYFRDASSAPMVVAANRDRGDDDEIARLSERLGVSLDRVVRCQALQRDSAKVVLLHLLDALLSEGDQEAVEPATPAAGSAPTPLSRSER